MSFTAKILIGLSLGVVVGLFLGDIAAPLSVGGDLFISLLQMTVLPYIIVSLVGNLGRISWSESRGLLLAGISALLVLLSIGIVGLVVAPFAFPSWETASFFSASLVDAPATFDFVALYVPSNPFGSMAGNVVPAVVLFSILLGIGLSSVPRNAGLLVGLDALADGLNNINKLVIRITPLGVFAIAASTAGTMSLEEVSRLQAYVITYTVLAILLAFVLLPLLTSAVTPFRYLDLLAIPRDTLITIFATAKIIVVLPQLIENVKELFRRYELESEEMDSGVEVMMPLAYPFPNIGTYVILMFVPFAAWYLGRDLTPSDYLVFQGASLLSSFVAPVIGVPFLLDILHLPADMMELFIVSTVYTDRIRVVLGAMHLLTLTILALAYKRGVLEINVLRLLRALGFSAALIGIALLGTRTYLAYALADSYTADSQLVRMHRMEERVAVELFHDRLPDPDPTASQRGRLTAIEERGALRVGFLPDSLPFAFINSEGDVVGFDLELAHRLARDLGVRLEMVRIHTAQIDALFEAGQIDIVMSGLAVTPDRLRHWDFPSSPMDLTMSFLVPDYRRREFASRDEIVRLGEIRLGVLISGSSFEDLLRLQFPEARTERIESPREFLRGRRPDLDAVLYSAEAGSAWTLIYPAYSVAVPHPIVSVMPEGYPTPKGDREWTGFVSGWIDLEKKSGTIDAMYDYWILGRGAVDPTPRWSVIRDVLGWVD